MPTVGGFCWITAYSHSFLNFRLSTRAKLPGQQGFCSATFCGLQTPWKWGIQSGQHASHLSSFDLQSVLLWYLKIKLKKANRLLYVLLTANLKGLPLICLHYLKLFKTACWAFLPLLSGFWRLVRVIFSNFFVSRNSGAGFFCFFFFFKLQLKLQLK